MNAAVPVSNKKYRLAQHYLGKLRSASRAYQRGDENTQYGLRLAQQDWPQIQQWQAWAASRSAQERESAALCSAYSVEAGELLDLMLTSYEQRDWCETALAAAQQEGDQAAELTHLLTLGQVYFRLNDYSHATSITEQALERARQAEDQQSIAQGLATFGQSALIQGKFSEAQAYHEQSLTLYRALQDQAGVARNLLGLGNINHDLGDDPAARPYADEALRIARQLGSTRGIATALRLLGYSWIDEDAEIAGKYLDECLRLFKQLNIQDDRVAIYILLGTAYVNRGEFEQAQATFEEGLRLARQLQLPARISNSLTNLGLINDVRGNLDAARAYYEQGIEIARQLGRFWEVGSSLLVLNSLAVRQRHFSGALAYAEQTLAFERAHDHHYFMEQSLLQVAFAHLALGNIEPALVPLREIASMIQPANAPALSLGLMVMIAFLYLRTGHAERGAGLFALIEKQKYPNYWNYYIDLVRDELQRTLGEETFAAALERGKSLDFEATVAEIVAELME